jgi:hypothetical protein
MRFELCTPGLVSNKIFDYTMVDPTTIIRKKLPLERLGNPSSLHRIHATWKSSICRLSPTLSPFPSPFVVPIDPSFKEENYKRRFDKMKISSFLTALPFKQNQNGKNLRFADSSGVPSSTWPSPLQAVSLETIRFSWL